MKFGLLICLAILSCNTFANKYEIDLDIALENIKRLKQTTIHYQNEVLPLIKKLELDKNIMFSPSDYRKIKSFWQLFNDTRIVLSTLNLSYSDDKHYAAELIRYSTNLHLKIAGYQFSKSIWNNKEAHIRFNEEIKKQIPRGSVISLENNLFANSSNLVIQKELPAFFPLNNLSLDRNSFVSSVRPLNANFISTTEIESLNKEGETFFAINVLPYISASKRYRKVLKRFRIYQFRNLYYSMMTKISNWIGSTKVHNRDPDYYNGHTLIDIDKAKEMESRVLPGDIILSRTNWFLSNAFLPGFWPHSFLYLGSSTKLSSFFNTNEVNSFYKARCIQENLICSDFTSYLQVSLLTKSAWIKYKQKDKYGFNNVLIEATKKGVHYSSIRHTFLNDFLSAMRPKLSKINKSLTIIDMFSKVGYEYDFDFDFNTDDRVVCSELIVKSYIEDQDMDKKGLHFNYDLEAGKYIEVIVGRFSMPVINFVHKIYDENVLKLRPSELEFVAFLKGNRKNKSASFSNESDFYDTRNWPKWSFMQ
jgi:hypothetical protein